MSAPTLVFGGSSDPLFPKSVLETTAAGISEAELSLVDAAKHAAFHERKFTFDRTTASFFSRADDSAVESTNVA